MHKLRLAAIIGTLTLIVASTLFFADGSSLWQVLWLIAIYVSVLTIVISVERHRSKSTQRS